MLFLNILGVILFLLWVGSVTRCVFAKRGSKKYEIKVLTLKAAFSPMGKNFFCRKIFSKKKYGVLVCGVLGTQTLVFWAWLSVLIVFVF